MSATTNYNEDHDQSYVLRAMRVEEKWVKGNKRSACETKQTITKITVVLKYQLKWFEKKLK